MTARELRQQDHYPSFPEFVRDGIDLSRVQADVLLVLQRIRNLSGVPIIPSPLQGAWSRTGGSPTSRHYAVDRLADAGDIFPARGRALQVFFTAQLFNEIGGLGLYADKRGVDGRPWVMIHFDLRPRPRVFWATDKQGNYWTLHNNPVHYKQAFLEIINMDIGG